MADSFISILDSNNAVAKIDSSLITVGANQVQRQRFNISDPTTAANLAGVTAGGALKVDISAGGIGVVTLQDGSAHTMAVNADGSINTVPGITPITMPLNGSSETVAAGGGQGAAGYVYDGTNWRRAKGVPGTGAALSATGGGVASYIANATALGLIVKSGANRICRVINGQNLPQTALIYLYDSITLGASQAAQTGQLLMVIDSIQAGQILDLQIPLTVGLIVWCSVHTIAGAPVIITTDI